jgi:hypothetical protein
MTAVWRRLKMWSSSTPKAAAQSKPRPGNPSSPIQCRREAGSHRVSANPERPRSRLI